MKTYTKLRFQTWTPWTPVYQACSDTTGLLESVRSILAWLCADRCHQGGADSDTVQIWHFRVYDELQILSSTTAYSHRAL